MFYVTNLSATLENARTLIPTFNFSIDKNDKVAIIAEEGNGKSTLLKLFCQIPCPYVSVSGSIKTDMRIGYLAQTMEDEFLNESPLEYLLKERTSDSIEPEQYNQCELLERICRDIRVDTKLIYTQQTIHTLSGGEKVRLQLLKLISKKYDMYCLDEPTNDLDLDTLVWLENWICQCKQPIIYISHDIELLNKSANRIIHLEQRNKKSKPVIIVYNGTYDAYIHTRQAMHQKQIQISASEKREYMQQKQRLNDLHNKVESDLRNVSRQAPSVAKNLKDKMRSVKSSQANLEKKGYLKLDSFEEEINMFFSEVDIPQNKIIYTQSNQPVYINDKLLINGFDFQLYGGDKVVIIGKNGCGKSIWMKSVVKQLQNRTDINIGYMPQNYTDFFCLDDTPISFLQKDEIPLANIQTMLASLKILDSEMKQSIFDCSEGQKAKIYLAKLILNNCDVLFLDEPSRNISPLSKPVLLEALKAFKGCIVCITHDRSFINSFFTRKITIKNQVWNEE